ncbi:MAG: ABC transporter ATP-binding protein [Rickettsiales bacterium]|jgi:ATP-binding cassette, subfamily B, bacterial|nr:ABC transporter ATP-binding protein [Rickettsiales bacterium]
MKGNDNSLKQYLWQICLSYKIYFLALFAISIIASLFEISVHYKIKEIIDVIATDENAELSGLLALFVFYKLMNHGMFFIKRLLDIKYKPGFITKITTDIYQKTVKHSLHWFDSHMSGEIADKINSFQVSLAHLVTNVFRSFVVLWAIVIGIVFLTKIHYLTAVIQLAFLLIYAPILYVLLKKQLKLQELFQKANQETTGIINDSVSNIFGIKVIGNLASEFKLKLTPALLRRQEKDRVTRKFDAYWVDNVDTLMIVILSAAQIYLLAYLYQNDQITPGGFAFVAMIMLKLHSDISTMLEYILFGINPQIAAIRAAYEFVNEEYGIIDKDDAEDLENVKGAIEFKDVIFAYNDQGKKILSNFNLKINAGEKIGLVGQSGAGKTTLIKSLFRYFDINEGGILVDDKDIAEVTQESIRANISIIPQDITMFHRSILENLQIAKSDASKDDIISACKAAKIHDDIMEMHQGYDSIVGERGVKVSGGQRQRIAIARAILKDAPILILDEATSSLDSKTEQLIQNSLDLLISDKSKTVIAIAHRLSTLKYMDRIIVLEGGVIKEEGSHHELIAREDSTYKKLWDLQEI